MTFYWIKLFFRNHELSTITASLLRFHPCRLSSIPAGFLWSKSTCFCALNFPQNDGFILCRRIFFLLRLRKGKKEKPEQVISPFTSCRDIVFPHRLFMLHSFFLFVGPIKHKKGFSQDGKSVNCGLGGMKKKEQVGRKMVNLIFVCQSSRALMIYSTTITLNIYFFSALCCACRRVP